MGRHETRWKELRCEVWRVQCAVWGRCLLDVALHQGRAQVMFLDLDSNTATASHKARTHGPGWRMAHASSIDQKGLLYIFKATSAPPRAGTTGITIITINNHNNHLWIYWINHPLIGVSLNGSAKQWLSTKKIAPPGHPPARSSAHRVGPGASRNGYVVGTRSDYGCLKMCLMTYVT